MGFSVAFVRQHKFSLVGWLIQLIECINIFVLDRKWYWPGFYHVSFYDEFSGYWYDANDTHIRRLTDEEFKARYEIIESFDFPYIVPPETRNWLNSRVGLRYSFFAIAVILRKFYRGWFGWNVRPKVDGSDSYICSELVLNAISKCGFTFSQREIEISSIVETYHIVKGLK